MQCFDAAQNTIWMNSPWACRAKVATASKSTLENAIVNLEPWGPQCKMKNKKNSDKSGVFFRRRVIFFFASPYFLGAAVSLIIENHLNFRVINLILSRPDTILQRYSLQLVQNKRKSKHSQKVALFPPLIINATAVHHHHSFITWK